ncbi:MAG: prepilin-type N-terminal cleavage/methylation domain-containing protein [Pirellulaceae bacterium]|nr:prepilin-type N-terminal cleavage/methylation domain-containing protein [Pirellulaceae bacterium]
MSDPKVDPKVDPLRHRRRRGFNLMECMATLAVLMVLGMAAATLLVDITQIGLRANQSKMSRASIARLSTQFRHDMDDSTGVNIQDNGTALQIDLDQTTIRYEVVADPVAIDRTVHSGDEIVSRERYPLTPRCQPSFADDDRIVQAKLTADGQANAWIIEAAKP